MLCNVCEKNEAKVHLTQMVEGKIRKVDLCETCAKDKGIDDPTGFSLTDVLTGMEAVQTAEGPASETGSQVECTFCGYTQSEFKKSGRLGCSQCYDVFEEGLEQVFKTMHRGVRHTGKVPEKLRSSKALYDRSRELQTRLDVAIGEENFEEAAVLRDELKEVRGEIEQLETPERGGDETT